MLTLLEIILFAVYMVTLYYTVFWLIAFIDYAPDQPLRAGRRPKVSVIVPAHNEELTLEKTCRSVLALDYKRELLELVIVNDGSTDKTLNVANAVKRSRPEAVKVISQENGGKWKAMNAGIAASSGEFVACLDADSTIKQDALNKMLPYFSDPKVAVVLPMLYVDSPKNLLQKVQWHEYVINMFYRKVAGFLNCIHVAPGPFSLYRKGVLLEIGGFREGFKTEDLEICMRLQSRHYRIMQTTETEAYTEAPATFRELYRQRKRWNFGSTLNILSYRWMLFNRKFGDFGVFQLPIIFMATFLAAGLLVVTAYLSVLKPLYEKFMQLRLINFDIMSLIKNFHPHFSIFDIDAFRFFIAASFLAVSVSVLVVSHRAIRKKVTAHGLPAMLVFMFMYYLFLGYVRLVIIKDLLLGRKNKW